METRKMKTLVCVVVYDRLDMLCKWLRAWNNAEKYGAELAVINNFDGDKDKKAEMTEKIMEFKPDYYVDGNNYFYDIGAFKQVIENKYELPDWDVLCWFTDDMLPMRRTFLHGFLEKFEDPEVGLVAQCYEPKSVGYVAHVRTVAFAVSRAFSEKIVFPPQAHWDNKRKFGHIFEHGGNVPDDNGIIQKCFTDHLLSQCYTNGFKFKLAHGGEPEKEGYRHWTAFLDYMWDASLLGNHKEYWKVYEDQFEPIQIREDLENHPQMLLSLAECERLAQIPNKVTGIICTSVAPIECFMWSVFSLLLRSTREVLEHFIVVINGPDERTGDPSLQDAKQKFLEELRNMKWQGHDMPVTVVRTWSRVGHSQSVEQAVAWVHTQNYLAMHDDAIILSNRWQEEAKDFFTKPDVAARVWENLYYGCLSEYGAGLGFAHFNSVFALCKKPIFTSTNARWIGYSLPLTFYIGNFANFDNFMAWHKKHNLVNDKILPPPKPDKEYNLISMDIGTWAVYNLYKNGYKFDKFSDDLVHHFLASSWRSNDCVEKSCPHVTELEKEIKDSPYCALYKKFSKYKFSGI
jgi:hypothetical protein